MDIVTNLLPLISKNCIGGISDGAFDKVRKKSVQLRSRMTRSCEASAPEDNGVHTKIAAVFLNKYVGSKFGSTEQRVFCMVDGERFVDSMLKIGVRFGNFPAGLTLHKRKQIGIITVHFIGGREDKT